MQERVWELWYFHRRWVLAGIIAVAAVAGLVLWYSGGRDQPGANQSGIGQRTPVTVAPAQRYRTGTTVAAAGPCAETLEALRVVFARYPSGAYLDASGTDTLNALLAELATTCDAPTSDAFRSTELYEWLTFRTDGTEGTDIP